MSEAFKQPHEMTLTDNQWYNYICGMITGLRVSRAQDGSGYLPIDQETDVIITPVEPGIIPSAPSKKTKLPNALSWRFEVHTTTDPHDELQSMHCLVTWEPQGYFSSFDSYKRITGFRLDLDFGSFAFPRAYETWNLTEMARLKIVNPAVELPGYTFSEEQWQAKKLVASGPEVILLPHSVIASFDVVWHQADPIYTSGWFKPALKEKQWPKHRLPYPGDACVYYDEMPATWGNMQAWLYAGNDPRFAHAFNYLVTNLGHEHPFRDYGHYIWSGWNNHQPKLWKWCGPTSSRPSLFNLKTTEKYDSNSITIKFSGTVKSSSNMFKILFKYGDFESALYVWIKEQLAADPIYYSRYIEHEFQVPYLSEELTLSYEVYPYDAEHDKPDFVEFEQGLIIQYIIPDTLSDGTVHNRKATHNLSLTDIVKVVYGGGIKPEGLTKFRLTDEVTLNITGPKNYNIKDNLLLYDSITLHIDGPIQAGNIDCLTLLDNVSYLIEEPGVIRSQAAQTLRLIDEVNVSKKEE